MKRVASVLLGLLLSLPAAHAQSVLEGRTLHIGSVAHHYPEALGELRGPVSAGDTTWLGVGPVVYGFNDDGLATARLDFSGPVLSLDGNQDTLTVTAGEAGAQDTYTVQGGEIRERVVFAPQKSVTQWLEQSALAAPLNEVNTAAISDPTNPFLALRHATQARLRGDLFTARSEVQRAVSLQAPFPATLRLAAALEAQGVGSAVNLLLERAKRDYLARGYDPALPVSQEVLQAYGDPLSEITRLLAQGQLGRADVWLQYLRQTSPRAQGAQELYLRYAELLASQGRSAQAQSWRDFATSLNAGTLYNLGPQSLVSIASAARLLVLVLALATLCTLLYLKVVYLPAQQSSLQPYGGYWKSWAHPLARLRRTALGHARRGEKLVVVSLLLGLILSLLAWNWAGRTAQALASPALNMGTYGGGWFYEQLSTLSLQNNRDTDLLRGLSAQLDGDEAQARQLYQAGGLLDDPGTPQRVAHSSTAACIQNNLGVLYQQQGNPAAAQNLWRLALQSAPEQTEAAYNLGGKQTTEGQNAATSRPPGSSLCYPAQRSTINAVGGNLLGELQRFGRHPWQALQDTPTGLSRPLQLLWSGLVLLLGAYSLLMVPAPALETRQRLTHNWLAWLLPGAAFLRSSWGMVPLVLWAYGVLSALQRQQPSEFSGLPFLPTSAVGGLLGGLYLLNTACLLWQRRALRIAPKST